MTSDNEEPESVVLKAHRVELRHHALHLEATIAEPMTMTDELEVEIRPGGTEVRQDITTEYLASDGLGWAEVEVRKDGRLIDFDLWNLT